MTPKRSKTCRKCGQKYQAWRCPACYRGGHNRSQNTRSCQSAGARRVFSSTQVLINPCHPHKPLVTTLTVLNRICERKGWVTENLPPERAAALFEWSSDVADRYNRIFA